MSDLRGPVLVVGAGLLGTSIGLALRRHEVEVWLADARRSHVRTAAGLGAGRAVPDGGRPALVVVAVPPAALGPAIARSLASYPDATVTDVGSVKRQPLLDLASLTDARSLTRYCGSHPMAGSERSGPLAASAALFDGRPWAVAPHPTTSREAIAKVEALAVACGATVVHTDPEEHDRAVARVSHLPHLMAVLVAGRLADADPSVLALSGQGVRDVTRIASGDPALWRQILAANAGVVGELLEEVQAELSTVISTLADGGDLTAVLARGNAGTAAIPGKHGGPALPTEPVYVAVPDQPGGLARIFADIESIGANVEDVRIDHDPGRPVGLLEVTVAAAAADGLRTALEERGWTVHR